MTLSISGEIEWERETLSPPPSNEDSKLVWKAFITEYFSIWSWTEEPFCFVFISVYVRTCYSVFWSYPALFRDPHITWGGPLCRLNQALRMGLAMSSWSAFVSWRPSCSCSVYLEDFLGKITDSFCRPIKEEFSPLWINPIWHIPAGRILRVSDPSRQFHLGEDCP